VDGTGSGRTFADGDDRVEQSFRVFIDFGRKSNFVKETMCVNDRKEGAEGKYTERKYVVKWCGRSIVIRSSAVIKNYTIVW